MKREKNLTEEQQMIINYFYENNIPTSVIAKHFKKDHSTIFRVIRKMNSKRKSMHDVLKEYYEEHILGK